MLPIQGVSRESKILKPGGTPYYSNPKAWMSADNMACIFTALNKQLVKQERILPFTNNVSSQYPALKDKFSNIIFLLKNTNSRLQPLDTGIIKNFKLYYQRLLLKHTLAQSDSINFTASAIVIKVDVLTTIRWIKKAWDEVRPQIIINCFRKAGVLPQDQGSEEDPFAGLEEDGIGLDELVTQFDPDTTADEYRNADNGVSTFDC